MNGLDTWSSFGAYVFFQLICQALDFNESAEVVYQFMKYVFWWIVIGY